MIYLFNTGASCDFSSRHSQHQLTRQTSGSCGPTKREYISGKARRSLAAFIGNWLRNNNGTLAMLVIVQIFMFRSQHNVGISLCTAKGKTGRVFSSYWLRVYLHNRLSIYINFAQQAFGWYNLFLYKHLLPRRKMRLTLQRKKSISFYFRFHLCRPLIIQRRGERRRKIGFGALINQIVYWKT